MCGIVGYVGYRNAAKVCIEGLKRLEYRGYDSYGIAVVANKILVHKERGKISEAALPASLKGNCAIGHTRWATHGVPNEVNAHPHLDCKQQIAVVHNGIIENFADLKHSLEARGHVFVSQTDTEVIPHLIEEHYTGNLFAAVEKILPLLTGSYAILVIAEGGQKIIAARKGSPLALGLGDNEFILASDVVPLIEYTRKVIYLEDGDIAEITADNFRITSDGIPVKRETCSVEWDVDVVKKGGFPHYMLKEIFEQPEVFTNSLCTWSKDAYAASVIQKAKSLTVVACGTSANASTCLAYLMEAFCHIPTRVVLASEFKYFPTPGVNVVIGVSQSGETADTLAALKLAREHGAVVLAVTNVLGSSITRAADSVIYTCAGPEISVAATKSFLSQVAVFMGLVNKVSGGMLKQAIQDVQRYLPKVLTIDVSNAVEICKKAQSLLYVGRGLAYPIAMEGALKMKEISYLHAEGYAAGELKHGPFALLSPETPVVGVCCADSETYPVMMSNLKEIKARDAPLILIGTVHDKDAEELADVFIGLPKMEETAFVLLSSVVMQVLAYYTAVALKRDVDMPRNLAKSVTVE